VSDDPRLGRALSGLEPPGEAEAEQRSWEVIRAAYAERTPLRPAPRVRRLAIAAAAGAAVLAIGFSPAGAKVGDLVERMGEAMGIGEQEARPALRSLPAAGELLVESEQGPWIVREDGSKRLLGEYEEASWSPRGLFVAVTDGRELIAVEPGGEVRWTIGAPATVHDPRWGGIGFDTRIAYRSGDDLWVVAGDGSGERRLARDVAPEPPAWRQPPADFAVDPGAGPVHVLTYLDGEGEARTVDADTGAAISTTRRDLELLSSPPSGEPTKRATSPDGRYLATLRATGGRDELVLDRHGRGGTRVLFSARGALSGPTWSPDGHWLLVGWPKADQWLFIPTERSGKVVAIDDISEQFDPGDTGAAAFPRVAGWIPPER
jgi:hypothetical protein